MPTNNIHASCVDINGRGVLIIGKSESGKSDLILRLIDQGANLVADDRCDIFPENQTLIAQAPENIKGLIEVWGIGIVKMPFIERTYIHLIVNLVEREQTERMPDDNKNQDLYGISIKEISLYPFDTSATAKIRLALDIATNKFKLVK